MKTQVIDVLQDGCSEDVKSQVEDIFVDPTISSPFKDLNSENKKSKFFSKHFGLFVSVIYIIHA